MATHGIVRTDRMHGTDNAADLVSVRYSPSNTDTDLDNGNVVLLGALDTSNREVFVGGTPAANSALAKIALIANPEVMADERLKSLADFYNKAGEVVRGYRLRSGDVFSVTAAALTASSPAIGNVVELQAGTKLKIVSSLTSGSTQVGNVIQIDGDYVVILVA